jgi:2-keto-4-pentenoate hydratase/2-oxohepta-3-ene-1,7-dioic acid hydratase in catechol pathway
MRDDPPAPRGLETPMKFVRYAGEQGPRYGILEDGKVLEAHGDPYTGALEAAGPGHDLGSLTLLAPCAPSKVVAVSGSYRAVLDQAGKDAAPEPLIFLKPDTAVIGPGAAIEVPSFSSYVTHEPELAVVIRSQCHRISAEEAADHVLGYTCANDVSARDIQSREVHMTRAKGFDTFCPVGPSIVTGFPPGSLAVRSYVDGEVVLDTSTDDMIFSIEELVSFASHCMTLRPGDVISTGAGGFAPMQPGSLVEIEIEGVGRLGNPVVQIEP